MALWRVANWGIAGAFLLCLGAAGALAEGDKDKSAEAPKSGVLSRTMDTGYQSTNVDMPWGWEQEGPEGKVAGGEPPISGSVSKISAREWVMRVFNNSADAYSVNLRVQQRDTRGAVLKTDSFSYALKPGEGAERKISSYPNTADAQLSLVSWRKLSEGKKPAQAANPQSAAGRR